MRISNNSKSKVYWRAFKHTDNVYVVGLKDGLIDPGKTASWDNQSFPKIKVEIKTDGLFQKILVGAGRHFSIHDDLDFDGTSLTRAEVEFSAMTTRVVSRVDLQVIDLRRFDDQITRTLESRFERVFSAATGVEDVSSNETTWSIEGSVGGKLPKRLPGEKVTISAGWTNKITKSLTINNEKSVKEMWAQSWVDQVPLAPHKIHVIRVTWEVTIRSGGASYFGETGEVSIAGSASAKLTEMSSYDRVEDLPETAREALEGGPISLPSDQPLR